MIKTKKSYVVEFSEEQARQLYNLLQSNKERLITGCGYDDLRELHSEIKKLFDTGIR